MTEPIQKTWPEIVRLILGRYDEKLLREVVQRFLRPRNQWPVEELIDRCVEAFDNTVLINRRLKELDESRRTLLAALAQSKQCKWKLGQLIEIAMCMGQEDGLSTVFDLLNQGFLLPDVVNLEQKDRLPKPCKNPYIKSFEQWIGFPGPEGLAIFLPPPISQRSISFPLSFPQKYEPPEGAEILVPDTLAPVLQADGMEFPLRMSVLLQMVHKDPLRKNQQGGFFKRDLENLRANSMLSADPSDRLIEVPDLGVLLTEIGLKLGILIPKESELHPGTFSASWDEGLLSVLTEIWAALPAIDSWNPCIGLNDNPEDRSNPYNSACLVAVLALGNLPSEQWVDPELLESWVIDHHPYWKDRESIRPSRLKGWLVKFLLGIAFQIRMIQATKLLGGKYLVRLSPVGRSILGLQKENDLQDVIAKTLLVQPNLEILAFRQGLNPALARDLTNLATLKSIGPACQMLLEPESVYFALETGLRYEDICGLLERHGTRPTPQAVLDAIKTWSNKHERIMIYASATLLEFPTAQDLDNALSRGLPALKISDRFAVATSEEGIDFSQYRLTATRDYGLMPEKCVQVESDGVTLVVDISRSDLLLETELPRFADFVEDASSQQRRVYKLSPETLKKADQVGYTPTALEDWFQQRLGHSLTPAIQLILGAKSDAVPPRFETMLVVHLENELITDGIMQWPETSQWIHSRLGPCALAVASESLEKLRKALEQAGHKLVESSAVQS